MSIYGPPLLPEYDELYCAPPPLYLFSEFFEPFDGDYVVELLTHKGDVKKLVAGSTAPINPSLKADAFALASSLGHQISSGSNVMKKKAHSNNSARDLYTPGASHSNHRKSSSLELSNRYAFFFGLVLLHMHECN